MMFGGGVVRMEKGGSQSGIATAVGSDGSEKPVTGEAGGKERAGGGAGFSRILCSVPTTIALGLST